MSADKSLNNTSEKINVLIYSSSPVFSEAVCGFLKDEDDIKITGNVFSNRSALLDFLYESDVDIAILHIRSNSKSDTLDLVKMIKEQKETAKPLILFDDYNTDFELAALESGVRGFLPEARIKTDIVKCIMAMYSGEMWVIRLVMGEFVTQLFVKIKKGDYLSRQQNILQRKSLEIIVLVNKGLKNKNIASRLSISEKTVKHHLSKIFKKLKIKKRTEIKDYF